MKILARTALALLLSSSPSLAGGPLSTRNGVAVRYLSSVIPYQVDPGKFGNYSREEVRALIDSSFAVWQQVTTSTVAFQHTAADTLPADVNGGNYLLYTYQDSIKTDGLNPIILDDDGSITESLFGLNQSESIIGFAGSEDTNNDGYYDEGESVMNGMFAGSGEFRNQKTFSLAAWKSTFVHEFGHFLGLDHTQINGKFVNDAGKTIYIPTMYPTSTADDVPLGDLNPDDIAAISSLYPEPTFASSTGRIGGTVTRTNGTGVRGANVIAISTGADSLMNQVSTVTDYFLTNTGIYTVVGLQPGTYYIRIEPISTSFTGASSVGPFASSSSDLSFVNPVKPEYYNSANESGDPAIDTANARNAVTVNANQTTGSINLIANQASSTPVSNILEYHGTLSRQFFLPSEYDDKLYAVRFTTGINSKFVKADFYVEGKRGNGSVRVKLHQNSAGSVGGIPGTQLGSEMIVPFSSLTEKSYYAVDFSSQNIALTTNVEFHISFEVLGTSSDTLIFMGDDAGSETDRSSSYYDASPYYLGAPVGLFWYNFLDDFNYVIGYNLAVRAYISFPTSAVDQSAAPVQFKLSQNYPNPFNPTTMLEFQIAHRENVKLAVFDLLGREVAVLVNEELSEGTHRASWSAAGFPSGVYFYTLQSGAHRETKRMTLLK